MGFLDHSTNNILLDAVLTDTGRQMLARNDGSFSIARFALGDDEVDYTIVQRYGRTVGKEKIEKNTPIFEGLTNQAFAQKFKLVSISNPNLVYLPAIELEGITSVTLARNSGTSSSPVSVRQTIANATKLDVELMDDVYQIEMNNLFLQLSKDNRGQQPNFIDNQQRARYELSADSSTDTGTSLKFTLSLKSITDSQFDVYGSSTDKTTVSTYVRITGKRSGAVKEFLVSITK